jgi:hypothetical protein
MKNNIFCIDLTKFNFEKLKEVSVKFNIKESVLVENKKQGFVKLFLDNNSGIIVAFTTKKDRERVIYTDVYDKMLLGIDPLEIVKEPVQLELDSVLEKITKYGIDSLNKNEKEFLDNLSK